MNYPELQQDAAAFFAPPEKEAGKKVAGTRVKEQLFAEPYQRESLRWAAELLAGIEDHAASALFYQYQRRLSKGGQHRSANIWLRKSVEQIQLHAARFPLPLRQVSNELGRANIAREWADHVVAIVNELTNGLTTPAPATRILHQAMEPANKWGFSPKLPDLTKEITDKHIDMAVAAVARLQDAEWWLRQITKAWRRYAEHVAILVGRVRKGVSAYVSHSALQDYRARKDAAALWLQTMYAINPELELEIPLAEAVASSISNPEIRRHELMVRMRGFEDLAEEQGFVGEFYTWTAPSKHHAWTIGRNKKAVQNPRYQGCTPRDTQQYLCGQWAKARAKLARLGVQVFGFRVVEPHHDATPHWHLLLFAHPSQLRLLRSTLRKYAIEHHREELGRKGYRARFDWQTIDPSKGSATGYIAKYIAKNIDGHKVGIDEETGENAESSAPAVAAWSSLWGIRQFQQVGGPSVSVWRELRRLREATQNPILEGARRAADQGKWADFANAMGGIHLQRKDHCIKLQHLINEAASKYGEDVKKLTGLRTADITTSVNGVVSGVMFGITEATTRHPGWELSRVGLSERSELGLSGGSRSPWSSDNNCTERSVLAEKDPLGHEMAMLGLSDFDRGRLEAGATVVIDGLYVRLRDGQLITSTERPGLHKEKASDMAFEPGESVASQWRRRIVGELLGGQTPVDEFFDAVPDEDMGLVIRQTDTALQKERRERPESFKSEPLLMMLQQMIDDLIDDHEFRETYLG
ncbi:replication endonuclease [Oceanisphaera arctica]|uniref:Replication protein n=1 Tax=Oceanisphaera arctica TaxID=641510 RepID=A0A2P5TKB5_9GAMM|nr:replication endonuclease [Oceanisphaera arctica]PPL15471.1 replication protein [Oceanisphaera arctica]GHA05415.1 hypothetical protein GCM10007082_02900 [Oceanisphaera arctica]